MPGITGWWWCNHSEGCHPENSRQHMDSQKVPLISNNSSGWKRHYGRHTCNPHCFDDSKDPKAKRKPTDEEFIKYAGLIYQAAQEGTDMRRTILAQYRVAWDREYPNQPIQLDTGGAPMDFSKVGVQPLSPLASPQATVSSSDSTPTSQNPSILYPPLIQAPAPIPSDPTPSNPSLTTSLDPSPTLSLNSLLISAPVVSLDPAPNAALPPPSKINQPSSGPPTDTVLDGQSLVPYLRQHEFEIQMLPTFSQILGGLIPGCQVGPKPKPPVGLEPTNPVEPKPIHVVFVEVPDQRLCGSLESDKAFLTQTEVDVNTFNILISAVPKSLGKLNKAKKHDASCVSITIATSLLLAIEMIEDKEMWDLSIINWELYRDTLVGRGKGSPAFERLWFQLFGKTDLIVGGLPFSGDFLNTRKLPYGLSAKDAHMYYLSSSILSQKTTVWVNPDDLLVEAHKQETNLLLTECAKSLGFQHPVSIHIKEHELKSIVEDLENRTRQGVLKRSLSGMSQHVITPHTERPQEVLTEALKDQKEFWTEAAEIFAKPCWFFQPYMPLLLHLGELRAFVVNGFLYHTAYTTPTKLSVPSSLDVMSGHVIRPLQSFGYDSEHPNDPKVTGWLHVDGSEKINPANFVGDTFVEFVLKMAGKMVLAEEKLYKRFSGLRIFARFDVSVYRHTSSGTYQYVMNEVTRCHSTHLFHGHDSNLGSSDHMISHLADVLHYVASKKLNHSPPPSPP